MPSASGAAVGNYNVSATDGTLSVTQAGTATTLILSNQNLSLTATVTSLTSGTPTGTVGFYEGQTLVGTGTLLGGMAAFSLPSLPASSLQISAHYSGDTDFISSSSGPDPLLSLVPASSSLSVSDAGSAAEALTIASLPGYTGTVQFTCSGLPANAACTFQPATITFPDTSNTGSVTLTIDTGTTASLKVPSLPAFREHQILFAVSFFWLPGLPLLWFRKRRIGSILPSLLMFLVLCAVAGGLTGCGGPPTTPAGTSTIQVIATGSGGLSLTTSLTLVVQ